MKALTVEMETVTLIGKGRYSLTLCTNGMKLIVKYFFLYTFHFCEGLF